MKQIKSYFLFFSEHPIMYNFFGIALNFIYLIVVNLANQDHVYPGELLAPKFYHLINGIFFFNIILVYLVSSKFITRKRNDVASDFEDYTDSEEWFRAVVYKDGAVEIVDKPLWGKGKVYYVKDHRSFYRSDLFAFTQKLIGRYGNTNMTIDFSIKLEFDSPCDKKEIFQYLYQKHLQDKEDGQFLLLDNYINYVFKKFNDKLQPKLDELVTRYATREISEPYLLDQAIEMVTFPERIFSNIKNTKLCLNNLEFSSCKGVDCSL